MKIYILAVESKDPSRTYKDLDKTLSSHAQGEPCHVLDNAWCIRSDRSLKDLYNFINGKVIHSDDGFVLAPLDEPWLSRNAKTRDDCFDLNE